MSKRDEDGGGKTVGKKEYEGKNSLGA